MSKENKYENAAQSLIDEVNRLRKETEKVAVEFAEWITKSIEDIVRNNHSYSDLYQYFIENVYNK